MRFSQTLTLTAAAVVVGCVAGADPQTFTLDDCKSALSSLKEKPYSSSLPSMAASTGKFCLWKKRGGGRQVSVNVFVYACAGQCTWFPWLDLSCLE